MLTMCIDKEIFLDRKSRLGLFQFEGRAYLEPLGGVSIKHHAR